MENHRRLPPSPFIQQIITSFVAPDMAELKLKYYSANTKWYNDILMIIEICLYLKQINAAAYT